MKTMGKNTNEYFVPDVEGTDPVRLVDLLYRRALRDLENAGKVWPDKTRRAEAIRSAVHAQMILKELYSAVNLKDGGEFAANLVRLYEFMLCHLMEALNGQDQQATRKISDVIGLLRPLSEAWSTITREHLNSYNASLAQSGSLVA
jgi:flagellar protein FliS